MSADNYNLVRKCNDGKYRVWLNLSASDEKERQVRSLTPHRTFDEWKAAMEWTRANEGYTEYGTEQDEEPPDGIVGIAERVLKRNAEFREGQPHAVEIANSLDASYETQLARAVLAMRAVVEAARARQMAIDEGHSHVACEVADRRLRKSLADLDVDI